MVGHATHISGTIGEDTNNGIAEAGIAYNVKIMPVKVCVGFWEIQFLLSAGGSRGFPPVDAGGCDVASIVQGIRYAADNGASVINLSFGGPQASLMELDALNYAVGKGVFISISAGNAFEDGNAISYPAGYASGIKRRHVSWRCRSVAHAGLLFEHWFVCRNLGPWWERP